MAQGKEIRTKIASVRNTQKITSAMEMVAASKMRRAQERMRATRPYAERIRTIIGRLAAAYPEYTHPLMQTHAETETTKVAYIVVSSDRGLCGGLNTNLFRAVLEAVDAHENKQQKVLLGSIGNKAGGFFKSSSAKIIASATQIGDTPSLDTVFGVVTAMADAFVASEVHAVYLASNTFVNTMTQQPTITQLLPLVPTEEDIFADKSSWDYLYEPSAETVLETLLMRYIESVVYQAVVENIACEQAARMIAMKSATDNAGSLIKQLQIDYNKARQAMITQELSEIVAGAAAV